MEEAGVDAVSLQQRGILTFVFDDQPLPWEVHGEAHSSHATATTGSFEAIGYGLTHHLHSPSAGFSCGVVLQCSANSLLCLQGR